MWEFNLTKNKKRELPDPIGFNKQYNDQQGVEHKTDLKKVTFMT
jgi:hypothetical protein